MSYEQNIVRDGVYENILALLRVDIFFSQKEFDTVESGSGTAAIVTKNIPEGYIPVRFGYPDYDKDGNRLPESTQGFSQIKPFSSSLNTARKEWSWDRTNSKIYAVGIDSPSAGTEDSAFDGDTSLETDQNICMITCVFPISQRAISWYLNPLDNTTEVVRYKPIIQNDFSIQSSLKDRIYGSIPSYSASIEINNSSTVLNEALDSGKVSNQNITIYRISGEPSVDNVAKIMGGKMSDLNYTDQTISINFKQGLADLDAPFVPSYETLDDIPGLDASTDLIPDRAKAKYRTIFGFARAVRCELIDYDVSVSTSNNREWLICNALGETAPFIESTGPVNASKISFNAANDSDGKPLFRVGDRVRVVQGANTEYKLIKSSDPAGIAEFNSALGGSFTSASDVTVSRYLASRVFVNKNGTFTEIYPFRDYDYDNPNSADYLKLTLKDNFEATVGVSALDPDEDYIVGYFYGPRLEGEYTVGTTDITAHNKMPCVAHPAAIVYLMLTLSGIAEDGDIDTDSFDTALSHEPSHASACGFIDPLGAYTSRESFASIIKSISLSFGLLIFKDKFGKWKIIREAAGSGTNHTVFATDMLSPMKYVHKTSRAYDTATAQYDYAEVPASTAFPTEPTGNREVTVRSILGKSLYKSGRNLSFKCYALPYEGNMTIIRPYHSGEGTDSGPFRSCNNVAQIAGGQRNIYKLNLRKKFSLIDYGDTVTIKKERLPGFKFEKGTLREVTCKVVAITRKTNSIEIECEEQRIEKLVGRATFSTI